MGRKKHRVIILIVFICTSVHSPPHFLPLHLPGLNISPSLDDIPKPLLQLPRSRKIDILNLGRLAQLLELLLRQQRVRVLKARELAIHLDHHEAQDDSACGAGDEEADHDAQGWAVVGGAVVEVGELQ